MSMPSTQLRSVRIALENGILTEDPLVAVFDGKAPKNQDQRQVRRGGGLVLGARTAYY